MNERGLMLVIWHRALASWLPPGGHLAPGDVSLVDAARRELAEETGVRVPGPVRRLSRLMS